MRRLPAITAHVYHQQRRGAVIWGAVFGMYAWVSAVGYEASYPKLADRIAFAKSLGTNAGIRAIFGPAHGLTTVPGFTAWRSATAFAALGAAWGLLLATKHLRGDEEERRAELLFAGPVTRAGGMRQAFAGLVVTWLVLLATVAACFVTIGELGHYFGLTAALFFSVVACAGAAVGIGAGAVTSQLTITRRAASSIGGGFIAVAFLVRALGETVDGGRWLLWLSPVSWLDKTRPLTASRFGPLALVAALVALSIGVAASLARRRDLGGSILPSRDTAEARTALLSSPLGLAARLVRPALIGWSAAVFIGAAIFGTVSSAISGSFASNKSVSDIFSRMGSEVSAKGYIGLTFVILGGVVSATAASLVTATRKEEAEGRLEYLAASPIPRWQWLTGRVATGAATLLAIGLAAGVGGWCGVVASGGHIGLGAMVLAGVNIVAPGVVTLGTGALVHGVAGRAATVVSYATVVWSFLVELTGSVIKLPRLIANSSLIHHLAAAPLVSPRWQTNLTMLGLAVVATAFGAAALQRRDLQPD